MRVLAVLVLLALPSVEASVRLDNALVDRGYVADEPNAEGDGGAVRAALAGEASGILAVQWLHGTCAVACLQADTLAFSLVDSDTLLPGPGRFEAWYGVFADLDGDGWIRPANGRQENAHASIEGSCQASIRADDRNGIGSEQGVVTPYSVRCRRETEWAGEGPVEIVAYVSPGEWNGADVANRGTNAWDPLAEPRSRGAERPDLAFALIAGAPGEITGRYASPSSGADLLLLDQSMLQRLLVEAFSHPVAAVDEARTLVPSDASRVDVDVYDAIDPAIERIYADVVVAPMDAWGCDVARLELGCPKLTDPATEPLRETKDAVLVGVGPAVAPFFAKWERDPQDADREAPSPYLDVVAEVSLAASLVKAHVDAGDRVGRYTPFSNAEFSASGDGRARATPHMSFRAYLGVWQDVDGDGWIGSPVPRGGCPDVYDCGSRPNPHRYDGGEYTPMCGDHMLAGLAPRVDGAFRALLTPEGGRWGVSGVYVLSDRADATGGDPLANDGSAPYDPYDDALLAPRLVMSGPVAVTMTCSQADPGSYRSYERLVTLDGSNLSYGIGVEAATTLEFRDQGIDSTAMVLDVDRITSWTGGGA